MPSDIGKTPLNSDAQRKPFSAVKRLRRMPFGAVKRPREIHSGTIPFDAEM